MFIQAAGFSQPLFLFSELFSQGQTQSIQLLVDNSNTRTKFALASTLPSKDLAPHGSPEAWRAFIPTAKLTPETIQHTLAPHLSSLTTATICSVVPAKEAVLLETLQALQLPVHSVSCRSRLPIQIDYPTPEQIGADRLANASALYPLSRPAIAIDFGTAVTFDVVSPQNKGTYLGGVIAPGLGALCQDLHQRTALLPEVELDAPSSAIGKSTKHAMQVGAIVGYRGLIREILSSLQKELSNPPLVIATGGDAPLVTSAMPEIESFDRDLTLKGILAISALNHSS